jgi:N-acetylglucosamine-6-phosphate deacetylase
MDIVILHGKLLSPTGLLEDGALSMRAGRIAAIGASRSFEGKTTAEVFDAGGLFVSPGFIDAHTHGGNGYDYMTANADQLKEILAWLVSTGVTSVLPTLASSSFEEERQMVTRLRAACKKQTLGAQILGLHLEGPFLNPEKRGAQPTEPIRLPSLAEMQDLMQASGGCIRLVTLAPELPGADELIHYLVAEGVVVSAGHSNATYEEMLGAMRAGVSRVAHLFNGMSPFSHREPGLAGAALEQEPLYAELILDGLHLHPAAARIAMRCKGLERIVLVTDATQAAGLGEGVYIRPGNRKIIVKDGAARLETGTLAGSILSMDRAVANARAFLGIRLDQAVRLASRNAAESLNLPTKGTLAPGYDADIVVFDDDIRIKATFVGGKKVFQA